MKQKQDSQQQQDRLAEATRQSISREFASSDELLRHDAGQIDVPPSVAERLSQSIGSVPQPANSWWRRLLGS